jgi:hypothetical protein
VRISHGAARLRASFDDPNLVSCAGLAPVLTLAQRCDLRGVVAAQLRVPTDKGSNASGKVTTIVAGMVTGADSIDDLDVLRHGGMGELFDGVRAPSTLGSFLRALSWGNVGQLEAVNRRLLAELAARTPVLADADKLAFLDVDSCQRRVYGHAKQGAGFGHAKVGGYSVRLRGLNPLIAAISTPTSVPLVAGTRLRGGTAASTRGAASFVAEAIGTARAAGATGLLVVRMDSAFYAPPPSPPAAAAGPGSPSPPGWTPRSAAPSGRSPITPGWASGIRRRSGTTTSNGGSPTPRSPRSTTPRSRPGISRRSPRS